MKHTIEKSELTVPTEFEIYLADKPTFTTWTLANKWIWSATVKIEDKPEPGWSIEDALNRVFGIAQNTDGGWAQDKRVTANFADLRSLSVGDIIMPKGQSVCYVVENFGFTTMFTSQANAAGSLDQLNQLKADRTLVQKFCMWPRL